MNSRIYDIIYSKEEIMAKKLYFSSAMVTFSPAKLICSMNAPRSSPISLDDFSKEQMLEIEEYLHTYTEIPYVIEAKERLYVVVPSIYPTSSMCLFLRIEYPSGAFLRFARDRADLFVLSPYIAIQASRMTKRLESQRSEFDAFCRELECAFTQMGRYSLYFDETELEDGYCEELVALSRFFAVPINEITVKNFSDGVQITSNFALFSCFSACMMMLARNDAIDRGISFELDFMGGKLMVKSSFRTDKEIKITNETLLWNHLASDRKMIFESYDSDGRFHINFRPHFVDWAYLGLKQDLNEGFFVFEEEE